MAASVSAQSIPFTPVLDTSAYADNDVFFNSIEITNVFLASGRCVELISISGHDEADQGIDFDVVFTQAALTLGTINSAVSAADSAITAAGYLAHISIVGADYIDLINGQGFCKAIGPHLIEAAGGSRSLFASGIIRSGTPTFAADSLKMRIGVRRH